MMTKDEALKLALEALENAIAVRNGEGGTKLVSPLEENAITAIKEALAPTSTQCEVQPEQEPVAEKFEAMHANGNIWITTIAAAAVVRNTPPPQRKPLTDEFCITNMVDLGHCSLQIVFKSRKNADEFKAALKEKNT